MEKHSQRLGTRVEREQEHWSNDDILVTGQRFKNKIAAAFENPHLWKMEKARERIIQKKCVDSIVLDYGCYDGTETSKYLGYGARFIYGIDISGEAIGRAKARYSASNVEFRTADAHNLPFEDDTFDLVVGRAILHHLDVEIAYREISRVLKPGGVATFVEPLRGNPLAKLVRLLTPNARTEDECPLSSKDIKMGNEIIGAGSHYFSGFFSAPIGAIVSICNGKCDNWLMRISAIGDDLVSNTILKHWGRVVYLYFKKVRYRYENVPKIE